MAVPLCATLAVGNVSHGQYSSRTTNHMNRFPAPNACSRRDMKASLKRSMLHARGTNGGDKVDGRSASDSNDDGFQAWHSTGDTITQDDVSRQLFELKAITKDMAEVAQAESQVIAKAWNLLGKFGVRPVPEVGTQPQKDELQHRAAEHQQSTMSDEEELRLVEEEDDCVDESVRGIKDMAAAERGVVDQAMALVAQLEEWEQARKSKELTSATDDSMHLAGEDSDNDGMSEEDAAYHLKELKQASQSVHELAEAETALLNQAWELLDKLGLKQQLSKSDVSAPNVNISSSQPAPEEGSDEQTLLLAEKLDDELDESFESIQDMAAAERGTVDQAMAYIEQLEQWRKKRDEPGL